MNYRRPRRFANYREELYLRTSENMLTQLDEISRTVRTPGNMRTWRWLTKTVTRQARKGPI